MKAELSSESQVAEAIAGFLACARHQQPFLEGNLEGAAYVGRRLDHAWRALDHLAGRWVEERYQETLQGSDGREDVEAAAARARSAPPLDGAADDPKLAAKRHLDAAVAFVGELRAALDQRDGGVRAAAVALHLARRSFSAYRLAKYRWLERALEQGDYVPQAAYRWLEA